MNAHNGTRGGRTGTISWGFCVKWSYCVLLICVISTECSSLEETASKSEITQGGGRENGKELKKHTHPTN